MTTGNLKDRLARYRQIKLSVVGRKSGKTITKSGLVRAGRRKAVSSTRAGLGHAVVQERAQEPVDSD
jgi:hypothetical protein